MKNLILRCFLLFVCLLAPELVVLGQNVIIKGVTRSDDGQALAFVNISVENTPRGAISGSDGSFLLSVRKLEGVLVFSRIGYQSVRLELDTTLQIPLEVVLKLKVEEIDAVDIRYETERATNIVKIDPVLVQVLPDANGGIESVIKTLPGVRSNNELSSQYTVRGGNFDENLVYVNGIEVYRPLLIRSGEQEGLSFVNPEMVQSIAFSAGGFDARFGDKLSSVLDITYKTPTEFGAAAWLSLMGAGLHVEGATPGGKLTQMSSFRYKTGKYLLNSLETKGDYEPHYVDFQTLFGAELNKNWKLNFFGAVSQNDYYFVPKDRESEFGTVQNAVSLSIYFDGQELDRFRTYFGASTLTYKPHYDLELVVETSAFRTQEEVTYDIIGQYWLNELDKELGSETLGDSLINLGVGTFFNHGRNHLLATVGAVAHRGFWKNNRHKISWGSKWQIESISDQINEWEMIDSAGYSIPYTGESITLNKVLRYNSSFTTQRITAYLQDRYRIEHNGHAFELTGGVRTNYGGLASELLVSPRFRFSVKPDWQRDWLFRLSAGMYAQPVFYKELHDFEGNFYPNLLAQRSYHAVLGADLNFFAWGRPFKLIAEFYYKKLLNIIPYEVDNVRIRYFPDLTATGFVQGIDLKVNGEFVSGVDSWFSLSLLHAMEDIAGDTTGYIPRPSDQRLMTGVFFQDYLPGNKSYKVHLNMLYGSRLPVWPPKMGRSDYYKRMPAYKRVDIGFSKELFAYRRSGKIESAWLSLEVLNLLDVENTISYLWVRVVPNSTALTQNVYDQYAVPNKLTGRRFSLKLQMRF